MIPIREDQIVMIVVKTSGHDLQVLGNRTPSLKILIRRFFGTLKLSRTVRRNTKLLAPTFIRLSHPETFSLK